MAFICDPKSNRSNLNYPFTWLEWMIDLWPTRYKKPRLLSWIGVVFTELNDMYLQFLNKRCEELFLASADGTTIKLEKLLNVLFNNDGTEIYITNFLLEIDTLTVFQEDEDTGTIDNFVYNEGENPGDFGGEQPYVFTPEEVQLSTNFVINIPQSLASVIDLGAVRVLVDKYRFAYVTYDIKFY
jgi:hypothetical protein